MSTATYANDHRLPAGAAASGVGLAHEVGPAGGVALAGAFAVTAARHLLTVLPVARHELAQWHARAAHIPSASLRRTASLALSKRGNIEGAALFATLAPGARRRETVRALVAFQSAYNYLDALSELPSEDPVANGHRLHQALLVVLQPEVPHLDYYAHNPARDDGGYLVSILDACRHALAGLPSYPPLAATAQRAAQRIVDFQALNLGEGQGGHSALRRWATAATPHGSDLEWWETAAGAGSSLAVHALIAAAATDPRRDGSNGRALDPFGARTLDCAYFPWTGALHTLLDSLVDRREDSLGGCRCLLDNYRSGAHAASRLGELAAQAQDCVACLPDPRQHQVVMTAMCSYYLSAPECKTAEGRAIAGSVAEVLGPLLTPALALFRARRAAAHVTHGGYC
jgi:tetraprenyl-beta-curcumene synthase